MNPANIALSEQNDAWINDLAPKKLWIPCLKAHCTAHLGRGGNYDKNATLPEPSVCRFSPHPCHGSFYGATKNISMVGGALFCGNGRANFSTCRENTKGQLSDLHSLALHYRNELRVLVIYVP
jgi:hypothetical protein